MTGDPAVHAVGLVKAYGKVRVLRRVELRVPQGSVFGLLGRNGAGKTTTVRILATLTRPDAGTVRVAGFDAVTQRRQVRASVGLTGQFTAVDGAQTGAENLRMIGRLAGLSLAAARTRADQLLATLDLAEAAGRRAGSYSGGMRRKLDLAASLLSRPKVLFLDEPTTGLDLPGRQSIWQLIAELAGSGVTVFLTTQYLEEADRLADRIVVLDRGLVVADDSPQALKRLAGGHRLDLQLADAEAFQTVTARLAGLALSLDQAGLRIGVPVAADAAGQRALLDQIDPDRTAVRAFTVRAASLDQVFLALTGHDQPGQQTANV